MWRLTPLGETVAAILLIVAIGLGAYALAGVVTCAERETIEAEGE